MDEKRSFGKVQFVGASHVTDYQNGVVAQRFGMHISFKARRALQVWGPQVDCCGLLGERRRQHDSVTKLEKFFPQKEVGSR
ncbi:hypothetical protein D3C77_578320 [compost metagenome]